MPSGQSRVFEVIRSPEMRRLLERSRRETLLHEDFLRMPQPAGWSPEQTWRLLKTIRRQFSIEVPILTPQGYRLCYFLHQDLLNRLFDFERYCRPESELYMQLADRQGQPFIVRIQIEEAIATSTLDGLTIPYQQAEKMIRLDRKPRDSGERVIFNTYRLMSDIASYTGERFTPDLLWEFYRRVTDGVDAAAITRGPERSPLARPEYRALSSQQADRHVSEICAYANDEIGDPAEHPVIRAVVLRGIMRQWFPLPDWNGNVASVAYRLYCLKHSFPVLAYLPFSRLALDWAEGRIGPPDVMASDLPAQYVDERGDEDHTPVLTLAVQLVHHGVMELVSYITRTKERDEKILAALRHDPSLNHRQRSILSRALRHPDAEFFTRYHQVNHNVAYATARADLLGLVEKGYLVQFKRKRAFVFRPHENLQRRLRLEVGGVGDTDAVGEERSSDE